MPQAKAKHSRAERNPDESPRLGTFVKVIAGPYAGRYGVYISEGDSDEHGPLTAVVRTRDDDAEGILVDYSDIRPDVAGKR